MKGYSSKKRKANERKKRDEIYGPAEGHPIQSDPDPSSSSSLLQSLSTPAQMNHTELLTDDLSESSLHIVHLHNSPTTIYISGFCYITLLRGSLSINGYKLRRYRRFRVYSPTWVPALRIFSSSPASFKASSTTSKVLGKKSKEVMDIDRSSGLSTSDVNEACERIDRQLRKETPVAAIANECLFLIESIPINDQEWMVAAEDQTIFSHEAVKTEDSKAPDVNNSGKEVYTNNSLGLSSALLGTQEALEANKLEVTSLPVSWTIGASAVMKNLLSEKNKLASTTSLNRDNPTCTSKQPKAPPTTTSTALHGAGGEAVCASTVGPSKAGTRVVICGAKGVGKSTCLKYTVNRLLSEVNYDPSFGGVFVIDCDLGQPEFTVSGVLSLHFIAPDMPILTPAHLHLSQPVLSYFIGDVSSKNHPETFVQMLRQLIDEYYRSKGRREAGAVQARDQRKAQQIKQNPFAALLDDDDRSKSDRDRDTGADLHLPLVVNTDGFIRYMGAELLIAIMEVVDPTHVLHLSTDKDRTLPAIDRLLERSESKSDNQNDRQHMPPSPSLDPTALACAPREPATISRLCPGRVTPSKVAAVDLRCLRLVAYFLRHNTTLRAYVKGCGANAYSGELYIRNGAIVDFSGALAKAMLSEGMGAGTPTIEGDEASSEREMGEGSSLVVPFSTAGLGLFPSTQGVPPNLLLAAFNASLVGLIEIQSSSDLGVTTVRCEYACTESLLEEGEDRVAAGDGGDQSNENLCRTESTHLPISEYNVAFDLRVMNNSEAVVLHPCSGLGIVRAIDIDRKEFELALCTHTAHTISNGWGRMNTASSSSSSLNLRCCLVKGSNMLIPLPMMCSRDENGSSRSHSSASLASSGSNDSGSGKNKSGNKSSSEDDVKSKSKAIEKSSNSSSNSSDSSSSNSNKSSGSCGGTYSRPYLSVASAGEGSSQSRARTNVKRKYHNGNI